MGREATCICNIQGREAMTKVLLESKDLIVRGELRCVIPISAIKNIRVVGNALTFTNGKDKISLRLGSATAKKWLDAILKPPPTLAHKLGIGRDSVVRICGVAKSDELRAALAEAGDVRNEPPHMVMAYVESREALLGALDDSRECLDRGIPIWVVYLKGAGSALGEAGIRELLRQYGFRDTKVTSVSSTLTALRFSKAKR